MERIVSDFLKILNRLHKCGRKFGANGELSNVEFIMLVNIDYMIREKAEKNKTCDAWEEGITLSEFAKPIGMTMSAASKKITILEKKGLLKRENSNTDRRNVYITLTRQGKELCEREQEKKNEWIGELARRMGKEDAGHLIVLLNKAFDVIEEMRTEETSEMSCNHESF